MSKIDQYGLGAVVRALRGEGVSFDKIAKKINESYLKGDCTKTSKMAVHRWCDANNVRPNEQQTDNATINIYHQECSLLEALDQALGLVVVSVDDFRERMDNGEKLNATEVKQVIDSLTSLARQKQSLINSIEITQEKIYNFMAVIDFANIVTEKIKKKDLLLYTEVMETIKENPMLVEALRRIKQ